MRVNIFTQPLFHNYGGILQNYALQEVLRRMGHIPLTINVPIKKVAPSSKAKDVLRSLRNGLKKIRGSFDYPFLNPTTLAIKERELSFPQREFIKKYINKVDCSIPFTPDTAKDFPADAWIVGSDQIWRPWCSPNIGNAFFDFLDDNVSRLSYAASFGTDKWEIHEANTEKIRKLIKKFNAISVRERSGLELCKKYLDADARHVLDPTMLLSADDYLSLTTTCEKPSGRYIATYILDPSPEKKKQIKIESKKSGLRPQKVGVMHRHGYDSIETWLASIAHSELVITDSFHGTVFSLIFNKPVKILANDMRGNSRIESLLNSLNLEADNDGFVRHTPNSIEKLAQLKLESLNFLKTSLN